MATVVALLPKERGGPAIDFQLLFYSVTDVNFRTPSYIEHKEGYFLTRQAMKWFWANYLSSDTNTKDPLVPPLQASIDQHAGLQPAFIINGENNVLRE
jgi:acetyl esterase